MQFDTAVLHTVRMYITDKNILFISLIIWSQLDIMTMTSVIISDSMMRDKCMNIHSMSFKRVQPVTNKAYVK